MDGFIKTAKDILEDVVKAHIENVTVARSAVKEKRSIMSRQWPLVSLITDPGKFDDRTAQWYRYADTTDNTLKQRYVRGTRKLPIAVALWAKDEETADELFSGLLPYIPRTWEYDDFGGTILITGEDNSDYADNVSDVYRCIAVVEFDCMVAQAPEIVPTFTSVDADTEIQPPAGA
jgi:hypothetical protein